MRWKPEKGPDGREEAVEDVTEKVGRDSELDEHEQRLLECMVDPRKSIPPFVYLHRFHILNSRRDTREAPTASARTLLAKAG